MISAISDGPAPRRLERAAQSVFEQVSDAVLIVTSGGLIRSGNPAASTMFGVPQADVGGRSVTTLIPDWPRILTRDPSQQHEIIGRRADGAPFPIRLSLSALDDTRELFLAVATDLSVESRLHAAQKLEAVALLAGGVAHDFNNLLMIVAGGCETLRAQPALSDAQRAGLEQIAVAADHAASLSAQLLALTRRSAAEPPVLDLHAALVQTRRLLDGTIGDGIAIELHLASNPFHVRLNRSDVGQILINLAMNARDAMPDGGRFVVTTRALTLDEAAARGFGVAPGQYVELTVSDTGTGMAAETRARAFEPFFTTKAADRGTGLGLATVSRIVRANGGDIRLDTAPGAGTTFVILLPTVDAVSADVPAEDSDAPPLGSETALVVEDDGAVREIVVQMLRDLGYRALEAAGLDDALAAMSNERGRIDLLVSDVVMPEISGFDLAQRIVREAPDMKVLFMSGYNDEALPEETDAQHATVRKPFTRQVLARAVRGVLDAAPAVAQRE
jgi:PAS domain S-box-containing protein